MYVCAYLNSSTFDREINGEIAWTLISIEGRDDRLTVDHTTGRHHYQKLALQKQIKIHDCIVPVQEHSKLRSAAMYHTVGQVLITRL